MNLFSRIKKIIPIRIKMVIDNGMHLFDVNYLRSYSQEGEDMILRNIFRNKRDGFFVDVGAHHPKFYSNTYFFYQMGWRGINIDAMPDSMLEFNKVRPNDINLEIAIADEKKDLAFYVFNPSALNTFSKELAEERMGIKKFKFLYEKKIETFTLAEVLERNLPKGRKINVLSIDVEGLDILVLNSNDWEKYRPEVILVESLNFDLNTKGDDPIYKLLISLDYKIFSKTINTLIFVEKDFTFEIY